MNRLTTFLAFLFLPLLEVTSQDVQVSFPSGAWSLNGTLSLPDGKGPFPVVIFVHGSGPNDRDESLVITGGNAACLYPGLYGDTIRTFRDLANSLRDKGMAVLRYDKRSYTYGSQLNPKTIVVGDFIDDLHAAVDFIKTRPEIDSNCIGLLGHSQGTNMISIAARERSDISVLYSLGTAAQSIDSILAGQYRDLYYRCLLDTPAGNAIYNQILSDFMKIRNGTWDPNTPYQGAYPKFWRSWIDITDSAIINFNATVQPTLFIHGTEDFNVPLENAKRLESGLTKVNYQLYYLNGLNHYMTNATVPTVSPSVPDSIFSWWENYRCNFTAIREYHTDTYSPQIGYTANSVRISWDSGEDWEFKFFDSSGRIFNHVEGRGTNNLEVMKKDLPKGICLVVGHCSGHYFSQRIFIRD